ncbi:hypothetical protein AB0N31_23115 [Streptomyces sp. NPDC051051]|uniref:hypothetical protein n=1 Tax=Streptomyces sp. NPDC051051 TaxID=3155666 RepID=UPI0034419DF9
MTFDVTDGRIATVRGVAAPTRPVRLAEAWRRHEPGTPLVTGDRGLSGAAPGLRPVRLYTWSAA